MDHPGLSELDESAHQGLATDQIQRSSHLAKPEFTFLFKKQQDLHGPQSAEHLSKDRFASGTVKFAGHTAMIDRKGLGLDGETWSSTALAEHR